MQRRNQMAQLDRALRHAVAKDLEWNRGRAVRTLFGATQTGAPIASMVSSISPRSRMNARLRSRTPALPLRSLGLAAVVALLSTTGAALAADKAAPLAAKARLQHDRVVCARIRDQGVRDECLSEASTLYAGTQPSHPDESPAQLVRNVLKRCEALREPDRQDCVLRMQGQGTTTGSVAGGGLYRELVTREVGEPAVRP